MTPLPADLKELLYGYANSVVDSVRDMTEDAQAVEDTALAKLTALLSVYVEKAEKWDDHEAARGSCFREAPDFEYEDETALRGGSDD